MKFAYDPDKEIECISDELHTTDTKEIYSFFFLTIHTAYVHILTSYTISIKIFVYNNEQKKNYILQKLKHASHQQPQQTGFNFVYEFFPNICIYI